MKSRFVVVTLLVFFLSACTLSLADDITPPPNYQSPTPAPTMSPLFPQNPLDLAAGAAIFAEKCAPCHGSTGLGDGPMAGQLQKAPTAIGSPDIARAAAPANWFTTVTQGNINSFMPPFNGSLNDQQRWDVVAYSLSLGGSTATEADRGKEVYAANCLQCHGEAGNLVQGVNFSDQARMAKLTQNDIATFVNKGIGTMPGIGGLIPDSDIYAVSAYVRTFTLASSPVAAAPQATPVPEGTPAVSTELTPTAEAAPVEAPTSVVGTISGTVTNGSGGAVPAGLTAVLHIYEHNASTQEVSEAGTEEAPVDSNGAYEFAQVAMTADRVFFVSVNYADIEFESDPVFPTEGQSDVQLPITIYDTTTETAELAADQMHLLLDYSKPGFVQVVEFIVITHPGTKAIVPAEKGGPVVKVVLPKGYSNLQFEQGTIGDRYIQTEDGFADTTSVTPGDQQYQIVFAVDLELPKPGLFGSQKLEFSQPVPVKVNGLSVLVPEGVTLEGSKFTPGEIQDMGSGTKFQVFSAAGLAQGDMIEIVASGTPKGSASAAASTQPSNQGIIIGVGAFGFVLIVAGVWMYVRDRNRANALDEDDEDDLDDAGDGQIESESTMEEIMDAIMVLDDQFKNGNIQESVYKERRAELKAKLKRTL